MTVRLNLVKLLEKKGWTAYKLSKESGISMPTAYKLAQPGGLFERLEAKTIDALCESLGCTPGELIVRDDPKPAPSRRRR